MEAAPALPAAAPVESTPMLTPPPAGDPVLVLAPHMRTGRQISTVVSILFIFGFHLALISTALLNWDVPCERPLPLFLLCAGLVGMACGVLFAALELRRNSDEHLMLPTDVTPVVPPALKGVVLVVLVAAIGVEVMGASFYASAPHCALTSPIVHTWSLAVLLLYAAFGALVVAVPLLGVAFPLLAVALVPVIAVLVSTAAWLNDAGTIHWTSVPLATAV